MLQSQVLGQDVTRRTSRFFVGHRPPHVYPHVYLTSRTWLSQAFPSVFILQAIKKWRRERPGNEASRARGRLSLVPRPMTVGIWPGTRLHVRMRTKLVVRWWTRHLWWQRLRKKLDGRWCGKQLSVEEDDQLGDCSYLWRPFVTIAQMTPWNAHTLMTTCLERPWDRALELPNSLSVVWIVYFPPVVFCYTFCNVPLWGYSMKLWKWRPLQRTATSVVNGFYWPGWIWSYEDAEWSQSYALW